MVRSFYGLSLKNSGDILLPDPPLNGTLEREMTGKLIDALSTSSLLATPLIGSQNVDC
jgi:hypothetical protein